MSGARTVWQDLETRRSATIHRQRTGMVIAVVLLCTMAAAEVLFLRYVAGPESMNLMSAAEGIATPE